MKAYLHSNARMLIVLRTTVELTNRTYTRLRAKAAERGMRGFSAIVEEALERFLEEGGDDELASSLLEAEGSWSDRDVAEWERMREEAWTSWPDRSSTQTS
jgi:predicted DNA-binding protein